MHTVVVVESPKKVRTIQPILGPSYRLVATMGHLVDLPTDRLGIDTESMEPEYIPLARKAQAIRRLRAAAAGASEILLATDPDREGEAIAWHVQRLLARRGRTFHRVRFREITPAAIRKAVQSPTDIDNRLVDAQQARRVLDRLCGYEISPLFWPLRRGASAGRVQSAALHLLVARHHERSRFVVETFFEVKTHYQNGLEAKLAEERQDKPESWIPRRIHDSTVADRMADALKGLPHRVIEIRREECLDEPRPPFTTSTLQQAASSLFDLSPTKCMDVAQQLFEAGLITYHRTDSVRVAEEAADEARRYLAIHAPQCLPETPRKHRSKNGAQDAHEAIRPTQLDRCEPELSDEARRLYELIRVRFLASQSTPARIQVVDILIAAGEHRLVTRTRQVVESGWLYWGTVEHREDDPDDGTQSWADEIGEGDELAVGQVYVHQGKTRAPPAYTQATLVRAMEAAGIGRPSTYAPTVEILLAREYARLDKKHLAVTELGLTIDALLEKTFADIVNPSFTADWERQLDQVADGLQKWRPLCKAFLAGLRAQIDRARDILGQEFKALGIHDTPPTAPKPTGKKCPACGDELLLKHHERGAFLGCSGYPTCQFTLDPDAIVGPRVEFRCPRCTNPMVNVTRQGRPGAKCLGKKCHLRLEIEDLKAASGVRCPACDAPMIRRHGKRGVFLSCTRYPDCKATSALPAVGATSRDAGTTN